MATPTMHALMNRMPYLKSKAFSWTPGYLFLPIENVYFTSHNHYNILYRINNLFLNFLLWLVLPVFIFWVNRITKNPITQARNWKTIFSILHCLTAHGLILSFYFVSGTLALISFHLSPWKVIITGELVLLLPV